MLKQEIIDWLSEMNIKNYSLRDDLVDVDGSVFLFNKNLKVIPVQFGIVKGDFSCFQNKLKSLEGCPETVGGDFFCSKNKLKSLEGCPETVGGVFWCWGNKLESLKYLPDIKEELICDNYLKESEEYHKWKYHFIMNQRHA